MQKNDAEDEITEDQKLAEQTPLMMEPTVSRNTRDVILDITLPPEKLAKVRN